VPVTSASRIWGIPRVWICAAASRGMVRAIRSDMHFDHRFETMSASLRLRASSSDDRWAGVRRPLLWTALAIGCASALAAWPEAARIASLIVKVAWLYLATGARG
jgi:hypothetical protein